METQLINENRSLNGLLTVISLVDEGMIELPQSILVETIGSIKDKVDGIQEILSRMKSEQERLKIEAEHFTQRRRELENAEKRLKDYVVFCLENGGSEKLQGNRYTLTLQKRETLKARPNIELGSDLYMELNMLRPGTVKREYSFDAHQLKALALENDMVKDKFCEISKTTFPTFRVKKGLNNE
jgi:hypothetical protein